MTRLISHTIILLLAFGCHANVTKLMGNDSIIAKLQYCSSFVDSTVSKTVPIYEFQHDTEGEFINRFCDTLINKTDFFDTFTIHNLWNQLSSRIKRYYPQDTTIYNYIHLVPDDFYHTEDLVKCKGLILFSKGNVGIIDSVEPEWLKQLHIRPSGSYAIIEILNFESTEDESLKGYKYLRRDASIEAILKINTNGKIDPLTIRYWGDPIQKFPQLHVAFDWIEDYYKSYGLPSGCTFYNQTEYNDNSRPDFVIEDVNGNVPYYFNLK